MATAKKLSSGSWRCLVYSHTEKIPQPDGSIKKKRIYKSFTDDDPSPKGKRRCEKAAATWAAAKEQYTSPSKLTVKQAIAKYCDTKSNVLSPATLRGYRQMSKKRYAALDDKKICDLKSAEVQDWINDLSSRYSPKYVKNIYGLLSAVMDTFAPELHIRIKIPQQVLPDLYVPSDSDISAIIDYLKKNDIQMLRAVYLAAFGTLRRSEVCGLDRKDVCGKIIRVRQAVVKGPDRGYKTKTTKTFKSQREIRMPDFFFDILPEQGKIVDLTPAQVTLRFKRALRKANVPPFRFHDLRHYAASIMHALGVPDQYIMQRGGWSSDVTLKRIYRNSIKDYENVFTDKLLSHFDSMQHEMQHKSDISQ